MPDASVLPAKLRSRRRKDGWAQDWAASRSGAQFNSPPFIVSLKQNNNNKKKIFSPPTSAFSVDSWSSLVREAELRKPKSSTLQRATKPPHRTDSSIDPQQARPTSHDLITSKCKMGCTSTCRSDTTTCRSAPRSIAATNRTPPESCPSGGRHPCCGRRSSPSSSPSGRPAQPRQGSIRQSE